MLVSKRSITAKAQTLLVDLDILLPHFFFLLLLLEQVLLKSTIEEPLISLTKLEAVASIAIVPSSCSVLKPVVSTLVASSISSLFSYSLFNSYSML